MGDVTLRINNLAQILNSILINSYARAGTTKNEKYRQVQSYSSFLYRRNGSAVKANTELDKIVGKEMTMLSMALIKMRHVQGSVQRYEGFLQH